MGKRLVMGQQEDGPTSPISLVEHNFFSFLFLLQFLACFFSPSCLFFSDGFASPIGLAKHKLCFSFIFLRRSWSAMQVVVAFMATIQFLETRLHGRLELERGGVWFLEKEPSHWMIHFLETRLHGT